MSWVWTLLACAACGKTTYRPERGSMSCQWCGGDLHPV